MPRSARSAHAYCSVTGVERPYWLFSMTKRTGSFQTAARFTASWKSPSLVAPSPLKVAATRRSPRSWAARARPSATGSVAPEVADHPDDALLEQSEVERAVAPLGEAAVLAEELAEQPAQVDPARGEHAEVAVHGQDPVVRLQGEGHADRDGLLSHAREPLGEPALAQEEQRLLLDQAREEQRSIQLAHPVGVEADGRRRRRSVAPDIAHPGISAGAPARGKREGAAPH